jgi:hypothetical protein
MAIKQLFGLIKSGKSSTPKASPRAMNSKAVRAVDNFPKQIALLSLKPFNSSIQGRDGGAEMALKTLLISSPVGSIPVLNDYR